MKTEGIITEAMIERAAITIDPEAFRIISGSKIVGGKAFPLDIEERKQKARTTARACLESSGLAAEVERLTQECDGLRAQHDIIEDTKTHLDAFVARATTAESRIAELERAASGLAEALRDIDETMLIRLTPTHTSPMFKG